MPSEEAATESESPLKGQNNKNNKQTNRQTDKCDL